MKKGITLLLVMFLLIGCGKAFSSSGSTSATSGGADKSAFVGTYIGLHGSGMTLFDNGGAEYYWKEWSEVETGDTWCSVPRKTSFYFAKISHMTNTTLQIWRVVQPTRRCNE